jgi:RNA polymerase sigma factor (sigma-70 family)
MLLNVLERLCLAYWRKEAERLAVLKEEGARILVAETASPPGHGEEDNALDRLRAKRVSQLLASLPPRQRKVIKLVWLEGVSRTKAAKILRVSANTLRVFETRALRRLQQHDGAARKEKREKKVVPT